MSYQLNISIFSKSSIYFVAKFMNYIWKKNDKHQSKEHVNHIQDRQNSTCEKYRTARSPQYHVFQALSYFSRGSRREIVNYDMGNR